MGSFDVAQMEKDIVKPPPPPISGPTTFYLHGSAPLDETERREGQIMPLRSVFLPPWVGGARP